MSDIFDEQLLRFGPWQEFERNTARLLLHLGWNNPRIVGRSGDEGADVLATDKKGRVWVFQCKFSGKTKPGTESISEVRNAGKIYDADGLGIITSLPPNAKFETEIKRLQGLGLLIQHIGPKELLEGSAKAPLYAPGRFTLHEYQSDAVEKLRSAVLENGKGQIVMATGLGKTAVVAEMVTDLLSDELLGDGRILVVAHTNPLVNQLLLSFWRHLPKTVPTHRLAQSERPTSFEGITFATFQTLANQVNLPYFDLIIVDEAHHMGAPGYLNTIQRLNSPRLVGATATPWRADGVSLDQLIGRPVFTMGMKEGLAQGYLSNVDYRIFFDNIDWKFVNEASNFGYSIAHLNRKLLIPTRDEEAIRQIRKVFDSEGRRRGLVFSPSRVHARSFASDLRKHGFKALSLTDEDSTIDRHKAIAQFSGGKLNFLCVVDIFNEGIDVPDVDLLVFLRVTHSRRILVQQLGRGLRLSPGKRDVLVLDFAADIRRIHAALDLNAPLDDKAIERLALSQARISFSEKSLGGFFYEWIADLGNIQDIEDDEVVRLPILDMEKFNFPNPEVGR